MTPQVDPVAETPAVGSPAGAPESSETILDIFLRNVRDHPRRPLFTFVDDQGRDGETYDFERFHDTVARLASSLIEERQLRPGERVLLVYPPSLDFITAFMGCLYAGLYRPWQWARNVRAGSPHGDSPSRNKPTSPPTTTKHPVHALDLTVREADPRRLRIRTVFTFVCVDAY